MPNKFLNTRIQLKYDSYDDWSSNGSFVPLAGELCICTAATVAPGVDDVLFKVGDGTTSWTNLPWASAKAADVHDWAKKSWDDFKTEILPVITGAVKGGVEITETVSGNTVTLNHDVKLAGGFTGTSATAVGVKDQAFVITVPKLVVNEYGHVTSAENVTYTVTVPTDHTAIVEAGTKIDVASTTNTAGDITTYTVTHEATTRTDGTVAAISPAARGEFTVVDSIESDTTGHITSVKTKTVTLPEDKDTKYSIKTAVDPDGNRGIIALDADNHTDSTVIVSGNDAVSVVSDGSNEVIISAHDTKYDNTTTASSTDGKLNLTEDGEVKKTITFKGEDAVKVTSDAQNNIKVTAHDTKYDLSIAQNSKDADIFLNDDIENTNSDKITLKAGSNVTLTVDSGSDSVTISSSYVDTTYSAGAGLDLNGTEFSHEDTSSVTNLTASDRTYVTGLTFDGFGHVTGVTTGTESVIDHDTITTIENSSYSGPNITSSEFIYADDNGADGNHAYTLYLDTTKVKELVAADVTAAMEFKGATSVLPTAAEKGDMYKVSAKIVVSADKDAEGSGFTALVGDSIVYADGKWYRIPSGDDIEDTWRPVTVGTADLGSNSLKIAAGSGVNVTPTTASGVTTATISHEDTSSVTNLTASDRTYVTGLTFDGFGHVTGVTTGTESVELNDDYAKVTADTGSIEANKVSDEFKIAGDSTYITTAAASDTVTVSHKELHSAAGNTTGTTSTTSVAHGSTVSIPVFSYDKAGHITSSTATTFKLPTANNVAISETPNSAALIVEAGTPDVDANGNSTVTYNVYHKQYNTSDVAKENNTGLGHGGTFKVITGLSFEEGHVTGVGTTSYTLPAESNSYAQINVSNSNTTSAVTGNNTELRATKTASNFTLATGNKWLSVAGSDADDDTVDTITLGHSLSGINAGKFTPTFDNNKLKVYETTVDAAGHVTALTAKEFNIAALDTNTEYGLSSRITTLDHETSGIITAAEIKLEGSDGSTDSVYVVSEGAVSVGKYYDHDDFYDHIGTSYDVTSIKLNTTSEFNQNSNKLGINKVNVRKIEQEKDAQGNVVEEDILILNCGNASGWAK